MSHVNGFVCVQEKLRWVGAGGLAPGTLPFRPVQVHGRRGLAAPAGHGNHVIRLVSRFKGTASLFYEPTTPKYTWLSGGCYSLDGNCFCR